MSPKVGVAPIRREQIVAATIRCLARDGYAGLTMKRVATEAGVSPGILHYYFRDKRAILAAAAETVTSDLDRRVAAASRGARDPRARLRALVRTCLDVASHDRDFWTVFIEFWGEALHDPALARLSARTYARARRLVAGGLAPGIAAGVFRRVPVAEASAIVLAVLDGLSLQLTFEPALLGPARAARLCEDVLLRYLDPARPRPRP
jgi:AcrR family transcriptional regulator